MNLTDVTGWWDWCDCLMWSTGVFASSVRGCWLKWLMDVADCCDYNVDIGDLGVDVFDVRENGLDFCDDGVDVWDFGVDFCDVGVDVADFDDYSNKIDLDLSYINNLSLKQDIKIFFKTFQIVFFKVGSR